MKKFNKDDNFIKDERIVQIQNSVDSMAYKIAIILLIISLIVKALFFKSQSYFSEVIILTITTIFSISKNVKLGNEEDSIQKNFLRNLFYGFLCSIGCFLAIIFNLRNSNLSISNIVLRAILGFVICFFIISLILYVIKKYSAINTKQ